MPQSHHINSESGVSKGSLLNPEGKLEPIGLLIVGGVGSGKCAEKHSLITMADGTTKELYLVKEGDKVISYNIETGQSKICNVMKSIDVGKKKGYKLNLVGGSSIITSKDHKFIKVTKIGRKSRKPYDKEYYIDQYDWTSLENIKRMDLIAIPKQYHRETYDIYDQKIYELIGYLLGDGGLTQRPIRFTCENSMVKNRVEKLLPSQIKLKKASGKYEYALTNKTPVCIGYGRYPDGRQRPIVTINPLKEILKDLRLMGTSSHTKFIPPELLMTSEKNLYALLSGLLATDGWVDEKGVGYCTSSDRLKEDVSILLKNLGINCAIYRKKTKYKGTIKESWQFEINGRDDLEKIYKKCELIHKQERLFKVLQDKPKNPIHKGINKKYTIGDMMFLRVKSIEEVEEYEMWDLEIDDKTHNYIANNIIVHNSVAMEQYARYYHEHGYTIISLSDVKDSIEFGFAGFEATQNYQIRQLQMFNAPKYAKPIKVYHPLTFNIPTDNLPEINFYGINIKNLTETDLKFLAESNENKRSIQIILETLQKMNGNEGIHHLVFKAEEQTESIINANKSGIKYRSDKADDFFTKTKIGTEKTASEMVAYFKPFLKDYSLLPANNKHNLNIKELINDQEHYHIFTTKWITSRREKAFYIIHLLQELINNEHNMKHPVCIIVEEIRKLVPNTSEGYIPFLASELKDTMTTMRNQGKGFAIISTTQVYRDVHPSVVDSFNETVFGKIPAIKELEFIGKALKLSPTDITTIKNLDVGEFAVYTKEENVEERSLNKVRFFMPPHDHKAYEISFFERYQNIYPDKMRDYKDLLEELKQEKERIEEEVIVLKDKENISKREKAKENQENKKVKQRDIETEQKLENQKDKSDKLSQALENLVWETYQNATGEEKKLRNIARKCGLYLSNGKENKMAVSRIIKRKENRTEQNEQETEEENDEN